MADIRERSRHVRLMPTTDYWVAVAKNTIAKHVGFLNMSGGRFQPPFRLRCTSVGLLLAARWPFVLNCHLLYFFGVTVWVKGLGAASFGPPLAVAAAAPPDAALPQMPPPWQSTSPWFFKSS